MQATVTDHGPGIAVLRLAGELDADTAGTLHATLAGLIERPVPRIIVDLADLKFCDSIGLSAFVISRQVIATRGGWLRFACANPFMTQLLATVGLSRHFAVFCRVEDALSR
jgi:anti-sigma B factor antagonist